jgi:hypothetical protein
LTTDGRALTGRLQAVSPEQVELTLATGEVTRLARSEIRELEESLIGTLDAFLTHCGV